MIDASVKYTGPSAGVGAQLHEALHELGTKLAFDVEARAKENIVAVGAVDTGALFNGTRAREVGDLTWSIGSDVNYDIFVELGTRFVPARPHLIPALEAVKPSIGPAVAAVVKRVVSG